MAARDSSQIVDGRMYSTAHIVYNLRRGSHLSSSHSAASPYPHSQPYLLTQPRPGDHRRPRNSDRLPQPNVERGNEWGLAQAEWARQGGGCPNFARTRQMSRSKPRVRAAPRPHKQPTPGGDYRGTVASKPSMGSRASRKSAANCAFQERPPPFLTVGQGRD